MWIKDKVPVRECPGGGRHEITRALETGLRNLDLILQPRESH